MVKIDSLIFGYRKLLIDPSNLSNLTSILLRASIPSSINNDGTITIRERDFIKTKDLLKGRIDFIASKPLGLYGWWIGLKHKYAVLISSVIAILLVVILSSLVWDVRVEGNETLTDAQIVLALSDAGFEIGDRWNMDRLSKIEVKLLENNPSIAWININRRGCVAYVSVIEKEENNPEKNQVTCKYSNLVASADCVIEEITVRSGVPLVKTGDVVRKGDLLVMGVNPIEAGGGFCNADATVVGRVNESVSVEVNREYGKKTESKRKIHSLEIKIFKFSLNIFKRYGNLTNECDIIENEIKCSLFNKLSLPISIRVKYAIEYSYEKAIYTDDELPGIASQRLSSLTISRIEGADLLRMRTTGEFTDCGYRITNELLFLSEITERVNLQD